MMRGGWVLLLAVVACGEPEWAQPPARTGLVDAALVGSGSAEGGAVWGRHCAICHGASGAGDGFNESLLSVHPPTAAQMAALGDGLGEAIRIGTAARGRSPLCPPWGGLLDAGARKALAEHIDQLAALSSGSPPVPPNGLGRSPTHP